METPAQWRQWLRRNHATARDAWLVAYKKGASRTSLDYERALDEATCYGWVDGLVRGATGEYYLQRWLPRSARSTWSPRNRERARLPADLRDELTAVARRGTRR